MGIVYIILLYLGQAIQIAGSAFKDILYFRLALVIGISFELGYQFTIGERPLWELIILSSAFVLINLVQIVILLKDRMALKLTANENRIYTLVFSNMSRHNYKKLISAAEWHHNKINYTLVKQGENLNKLFLLSQGLAEVRVNSQIIAMIRDGQFIGEMSFLTGQPTTADVVAVSDVEYVTWDKNKLNDIMRKNPEISADLQKIFNSDLINKLIKQNKK